MMAVEEMSELTKELCKQLRNKGDGMKIAEEIADVRIMNEQLIRMWDLDKRVEGYYNYKLKRLEKMLK